MKCQRAQTKKAPCLGWKQRADLYFLTFPVFAPAFNRQIAGECTLGCVVKREMKPALRSSSVSLPPPLAVLDTLPEGGRADPISWCSALGPTPTLAASISWSPAPLCGPLQEPRALLSPDVINACLLQKGQSISLPGRWGLKEGGRKTLKRRK